jgi:hypothetical protein
MRKMVDDIYLHDQDASQYKAEFRETAVRRTTRSMMADATTDESQRAAKIQDLQPDVFCPNWIMNPKKLAIKVRGDCELLAFDYRKSQHDSMSIENVQDMTVSEKGK